MATVSNDNNDIQLLADGCTALLQSVFGDNNWYRWNEIKQQTQHDSLQTFITWMLDVAEQEINRPDREEMCAAHGDMVDDAAGLGELAESQQAPNISADCDSYNNEVSALQVPHSSASTDQPHDVIDLEAEYYCDVKPVHDNGGDTINITCDSKTFYCQSCQVSLHDINIVRQHTDLRHPHQSLLVHCQCCERKFARIQDYIDYHNAMRPGDVVSKRRHVCTSCSKRFSCRQYLEDHISKKHLMLGPRHECPTCHRKYSRLYDMNYHRRTCDGNAS